MPENTYSPAQRLGVKDLVKVAQQPVVECAANGFELPEEKARLIDTLAKDLPKDFTYRRLSASPSEFELPDKERTDVSFITTDARDRDGDVVLPQGGDWTNYDSVVPFSHNYKTLPVGICWWIRPAMKGINAGLRAKTHYPTKPDDWEGEPWLASAVLHLMQQPIPGCTGKSIGFLPVNIRNATPEEKAKRPDWKDAPIIDRWIGLEYSVAPVPANATAQMLAVSKAVEIGMIPKEFADLIAKSLSVKIPVTGTIATESMPACPKCMNNEQVQKKDDDGGTYLCMKCQTAFSAKDIADAAKAAQEAKDKAAKLAEALAAPYLSIATLRDVKHRQQAELAKWAQTESVRQIKLAIAAASGQV